MDSDILRHPILEDRIYLIRESQHCLDLVGGLIEGYQIISKTEDINHGFRLNLSNN